MQTLMVKYRTLNGASWYPALRDKVITAQAQQARLDELKRSQWEIVETAIDDDGMSPAEDERRYRSMCRAERRRGA